MENKTSIERIRQFIDSQKISERKFLLECGLPEGSFNKTKSIGSENLKKIALRYTELNLDWVITGRGEINWTDPKTVLSKDLVNRIAEGIGQLNDTHVQELENKYNNLLIKYEALQKQKGHDRIGSEESDQGARMAIDVLKEQVTELQGKLIRCLEQNQVLSGYGKIIMNEPAGGQPGK